MANQRLDQIFYRQFTDRMQNINTANQIVARSNDVSSSDAPPMTVSIGEIGKKNDETQEAAKKAFSGAKGVSFF